MVVMISTIENVLSEDLGLGSENYLHLTGCYEPFSQERFFLFLIFFFFCGVGGAKVSFKI